MSKKNRVFEDFIEYKLDSRYDSELESKLEGDELMKLRALRMKDLSDEEVMRARLLQLKLRMEEYLKQSDNEYNFTFFLATYIDLLYPKRTLFAKDINESTVRLSQVINKHREPKDDFIKKLMIHSGLTFRSVCAFQKKIWYQVYFHEKICDTMSKQGEWTPQLVKEINPRDFPFNSKK